jgi:hypothetical protein
VKGQKSHNSERKLVHEKSKHHIYDYNPGTWLLCALPLAQAVVPAPDGGYAGGNTAEGQSALFSLTTGGFNTAVGFLSLRSDTTGQLNTGIGAGTLLANTADKNTATGAGALLSNTTGPYNTANGAFALFSNAEGNDNTAAGSHALEANTTGEDNVALGVDAGSSQTTGSGNVYIGSLVFGVAGESNACYIRSIFGQTSANGIPVLINSDNKLGTTTSSKRFKENIRPMDKVSEALFALKPVSFHYKKEIDPAGTSQLGLVAEDVEKINPDLVVRDKEGKPYSVRYDQVNAMLLNEFLNEHRTVQEQQKEIDTLRNELKEQRVLIQKVSAQVEMSNPAPQVVVSNR